MRNFHDDEIIKYEVNLKEGIVTLFTQYYKNKIKYDAQIIFSDVLVHFFENELPGSIILELRKDEIFYFIKDNIEILNAHKDYLWPINYNHLEELEEFLIAENYNYFNIISSYGLCGWVLSKNVKVQ